MNDIFVEVIRDQNTVVLSTLTATGRVVPRATMTPDETVELAHRLLQCIINLNNSRSV